MKQERSLSTAAFKPWQRTLLGVLVLSCTLSACGSLGRAAEAKERLAKAQAMFAERCKTAGEKIHRRVEDVEGVLLLKVRPAKEDGYNQFDLMDPYGHDFRGSRYVESFIRGHYAANIKSAHTTGSLADLVGYSYIEAIDTNDGVRYRYTGGVREIDAQSSILIGGTGKTFKTTSFVLDKVPALGPAPRYGVTYDDISTREEREYWIAGSSLKVIDMQTNEVVAERVGYMLDMGQGNVSGGRSPWLSAADHACPSFIGKKTHWNGPAFPAMLYQSAKFVESVLIPRKGE